MKTPRDLSGADLVQALKKLGYVQVRQKGSHAVLTTMLNGEFHIAVPMHHYIKVGTLNNILGDVAEHHKMTRQRLIEVLGI